MIRSGFRPSKRGLRPPVSPPTSRSAVDLDVVEEERPLLVGRAQRGRDVLALEPGRVDVDDEQQRQAERAVVVARARDDEDRVRLLDAGDEGLLRRAARSRRSSRRAAVERLCEFEPASGSVIANATFVVPAAMPRSQRSFCSGVPCLARMLPTIAGETTIRSSEQPAAEISSPTAASADMPSPPPPYSSGMFTPR